MASDNFAAERAAARERKLASQGSLAGWDIDRPTARIGCDSDAWTSAASRDPVSSLPPRAAAALSSNAYLPPARRAAMAMAESRPSLAAADARAEREPQCISTAPASCAPLPSSVAELATAVGTMRVDRAPPPPPPLPPPAAAAERLRSASPPPTWDDRPDSFAPPRTADPDGVSLESLTHVLEMSGLPAELGSAQLFSLVAGWVGLELGEFVLVPLDEKVALLVLQSTTAATAALRRCKERPSGSLRLLPLGDASVDARRHALTQPLPKAQRQRTSTLGASRLIAGSLGIRAPPGHARPGGLAEERRLRDEERARKQRQKDEADAMWFDD